MATCNSLRLVSYNCRGWTNGSIVVRDVLADHDVCLIQEHWLFDENLHCQHLDPDFLFHGVSGMDSGTLLRGRPFGGCGNLHRKSLSDSVSIIKFPSKRFCAISFIDASK